VVKKLILKSNPSINPIKAFWCSLISVNLLLSLKHYCLELRPIGFRRIKKDKEIDFCHRPGNCRSSGDDVAKLELVFRL